MPSQKPRLNLTLDNDVKEVLSRLSFLMKQPQASIVNGYLRDMYPALVGLADALEDAENKKSVLPHLAKMSAMANQQIGVMNSEMSELYKKDSEK
jgi:hypothetical protein